MTVVDHPLVDVDEFAAISTDERREEPTVFAGSIFMRSDFSQSVEVEQRFEMPLRRDAGVVGRPAFLVSVDAEQSETQSAS